MDQRSIHSKKGAIAFDFDGVIHQYREGWKDGSIYDKPNDAVVKLMYDLIGAGYPVFILSTRPSGQIISWMNTQFPYFGSMAEDLEDGFPVVKVPFWTRFWTRTNAIGVTQKKLPALAYVDDRALHFTGDVDAVKEILEFKK